MENFTRLHYYLFTEVADPRVKSWPLMSDPTLPLVILTTYLIGLKPVKKWMEDKPAFELNRFMLVYNVFQVFANLLVVIATLMSPWRRNLHYFWTCHAVDYSNSSESVETLKACYFFSLLKYLELVETYVFILRKKNSQVTYLHLYHHLITASMGWCIVKYVGGGMVSFQGILNSFVHVIMYTYYLLTALGPEWRKACQKWKIRITVMQMLSKATNILSCCCYDRHASSFGFYGLAATCCVTTVKDCNFAKDKKFTLLGLVQFCLLIAHASLALRKDCPVPSLFFYMYAPNVVVIFYLFGNFFRETYLKKKENEKPKKA